MNATRKVSALEALVDAFKQGLDNVYGHIASTRKVPADREIRDAAASVLKQEEKGCSLRKQARDTTFENGCRMYGDYSGNYCPPANECPVFPGKYSWTGGSAYLDDEEMSLYDALRYSLRTAYEDWFREKRVIASCGEARKLTKAQLRRFGREVGRLMKNGGLPPRRNRLIKVTTVLDDGRRLVETMRWDGTLVSEIVK